MKRLFSRIALFSAVALLGGVGSTAIFSGCQPPSESYGLQDFASIRVLNFTQSYDSSCTVPLDVYMDPVGQTNDTMAKVNGLAYGQASVYANNLPVAAGGTTYHMAATPVRLRSSVLTSGDVAVQAGHRYSWIVFSDPTNLRNFQSFSVEDGYATAPADAGNHTYVRFINLQPNTNLNVAVNDPTFGDKASSNDLAFKGVSDYMHLATANDTSYTFFVTSGGQIVSRLAFQSFPAGSYHTIVFGGDTCRTALNTSSLRDTLGNALDSFRVRIFDDNALGNDATFPIPLSYRYNVINAMVPTASSAQYTELGFTINNDQVVGRFTFPAIPDFGVAPAGAMTSDPTPVVQSYLASRLLTDAIDVKAYTTADRPASPQGSQLFEIVDRRAIQSDRPYSIIIFDTIAKDTSNYKLLDSAAVLHAIVPLPEQSTANTAQIVVVNAISRTKGVNQSGNGNNASFFLNGNAASFNGTTGAKPGRSDVFTVTLDPGTTQQVTLTTKVAASSGTVDGGSATFNVKAGGIYEAVLAGQRANTHFILVQLNNPKP